MSKMFNLISLMGGLLLLFYFFGLLGSTSTTGTLMKLILNPSNIQNSDLGVLFVAGSGILLVAITFAAGTILNRYPPQEFYIWTPLVGLFFSFVWDFIKVYQVLASTGPIGALLGILIFGVFLVLCVISVIEWWRVVQ